MSPLCVAQVHVGAAGPAHDIERRLELAEHGWVIIHVTSDMLRDRPWLVLQRVVAALRAAGCPWLAECGLVAREFEKRVS